VPRLTGARPSESLAARATIENAVAFIGIALLACAALANQRWLDRHFLPSWFVPHSSYVLIESSVRAAIAAVGLSLVLFLRRRIARLMTSAPARVGYSFIAAALAIVASEMVLRHMSFRTVGWLVPDEEPRRRADPRLGWIFEPARTGRNAVGGRVIDYAVDQAGYRVRSIDEPVDPERPAMLFIGESVMFGEGLMWEESVPAQVGAMMGIQSANLAVHGYGTDQAYLRLERELPRFQRPVAVVSLFMTALFGRNLDDDRPHLGPGLVWFPAAHHGRLTSLGTILVPYRTDDTVERGVTMTREVLGATVNLARARGATPLVVVPHFGAEEEVEHRLRQRLLDETGLPYVWIQIDEAWRIPGDRHPNARAAQAIATAIASQLRRSW
jgi:hypothetical protein